MDTNMIQIIIYYHQIFKKKERKQKKGKEKVFSPNSCNLTQEKYVPN